MTAQARLSSRKRPLEFTSSTFSPFTSSDSEESSELLRVAGDEWNRAEMCDAITNDLQEKISSHVGPHTVTNDSLACFYDAEEQSFELEFYVDRLLEYCGACEASHVAAMTYLTRVQAKLPITKRSVHRALASATILAIKYLEDEICDMEFYARVFGVDPEELVELESAMINLLEWHLRIDDREFHDTNNSLRLRSLTDE